jgi:hypothetical protein
MNTPIEVQADLQVAADIKLGEALVRLEKNKDFKLIIRELFLDGGSVNLAKNINVVKNQDEVIEQIRSRGYLYRFLMELEANHLDAINELASMQQEQGED